MSALETLLNITFHTSILESNLRYCLVDDKKHPFRLDGKLAKPNCVDDFADITDFFQVSPNEIAKYAGIGVSIQGSNVCAIDVDHCFTNPFDLSSGDSRANDIIEMFKDYAYIEFSFSGLGLRVFFKQHDIENYSNRFYTKAEKYGIEFYQPSNSARYVTITGRTLYDNDIETRDDFSDTVESFLNKYMKRQFVFNRHNAESSNDNRSLEQLMKIVKSLYLKNYVFQNKWFDDSHALDHGNSRESHNDYQLMALLYENVTQNREKLRLVFEQSPYFKTKDSKHKLRWTKNDYRYYNYQFDVIAGKR